MKREDWDIVIPGDKAATIQYAVDHFLDIALKSIENHGYFSVALSGGSTPKAIYEALAQKKDALDWSRVLLFWSDERQVPPDHPDSNYKMAMDALSPLPLDPTHIFRMTENYEDILDSVLPGPFDLIMLGLGQDGHTASLFPDTSALSETEKRFTQNPVPKLDTTRLTLTYPCINAAQNVAIYVIGDSKAKILEEILENDTNYPIDNIEKALWIVDSDAFAAFYLK